jgi:nucleoside-diphosphate-sugar epimerase
MSELKRIVITGAAGFVGSHLTDAYLDQGVAVVGLDNYLTGRADNLALAREKTHFSFKQLDLNDTPLLLTTLDELARTGEKIDAMIHLASPASPPRYQQYPVATYLVNSLATHHLLTWLQTHSPETRFLFASTSEVYGSPAVHPQPESYWGNVNPNGVRSCYDEAKRLGETICGVFARDFGLDVRIMRIFNTYGPRMNLADGRILPQFIKQYFAGQKLTVYGDGSQTRSYCFVSDLVAGIMKLIDLPGLKGETVNLGNPSEFTVLQTAQIFNDLTGRPADHLEFLPLPEDDPLRRQPDITKAKQLLAWQPTFAFRDGLVQMLQSYQKGQG